MQYNFVQRLKNELKYIFSPSWTFQAVGNHWDETTDYDDINERTYSYFRRFVDAYELFDLPPKKYTLDICSRTGNGSLYFWKRNKISRVVCADVTRKMQEICSANLKKYPISFEVKHFEAYPLPFEDNQFETILSFETIEHLPRPKKFVEELYRVLKPEGNLILTMPNVLWEPVHWVAAIFNIHHSEGPHRFIRHIKVKKWFRKNGFIILKQKSYIFIPGGPKLLIKLGEWLEKNLPNFLTTFFCLRRIYVCKK